MTDFSKKTTLFLQRSMNVSKDLAVSVINEIGERDFLSKYKNILDNEGTHLADCIDGSALINFYELNKDIIIKCADELAQDISDDGMLVMISEIKSLNNSCTANDISESLHNKKSEKYSIVAKAVAWLSIEEVCRAYDYFDIDEGQDFDRNEKFRAEWEAERALANEYKHS